MDCNLKSDSSKNIYQTLLTDINSNNFKVENKEIDSILSLQLLKLKS